MTNNTVPDDDRGEIFVTTHDGHFVIQQERHLARRKRVTLSFTLEEAEDVVDQLTKRIRLQKELKRRGLT